MAPKPMGVTEAVVQFSCGMNWETIPADVMEMCKLHILDTIGVLFAGSRENVAGIVREYVKSLAGPEESTLITQGIKTSAPYAAFGNGVMAHVLDFDDYEGFSKAHTSVVLLPAVLALGEKLRATGKECLDAYLVGVEVISKIGKGINPSHYEKGWHSTSTLGTLGAALSASKLLKLSPEKTRMALGLSASMASGLRGNFGTMTKAFHAGHAAKSGVEAALLAFLNFTASENILEGDVGFLNAFTEQKNYDIAKITVGLGDPFAIISPGVGKKLYPSCAATHGFIDGIFSLIGQFDIRAEDVESVDCGIFYLYPNMLIHSSPRTGLEGKFSLEFCLAVALKERKVTLEQFTDSKVQDPRIIELIKRVKKSVSEEAGGRGTRYPKSIITLRLKNGKSFSYQSETRTGGPMKPLSSHEIRSKFLDCSQRIHSREKALRILEELMNLEQMGDVSKLIELL